MSPRSLVSALDLLTLARGAQRDRRRQKPRGRGTKAAATLGGERLEPRLALAIDFASGLPADMTASAYLFIGDHSVSNSEIWRMNVAATPLSAPDFGVVLREQGTFARGVSYPITVDWLDSNRAAGPDYDYRAWIDRSANPTWTSGSPTPSSPDFFVTDPGQLLQRRWFGSEVNATLGKTAELHFPGVDLDVDSDNSGSVDGSPAEDALELVSTTGVNVPVSTASMAGLTPLVVGISDNLRHAATTGQVSFTFSSTAPTAFRLWRDAARTLPLPWGTAVTAAQLGLAFGGRLNLQLEAVTQTSSFAAITTTALVTGGIWQGTLQDTVRARGVPGVDLDVTPRAVAEDGFQGLTYTFSRAVATSSPLTINYVLGGSATQAIDFSGLPAASGTRSMTIPAGATTASLTVFPTPDSDIEPDETVMLTLLPGTGYAVSSKSVAMGTIINDDLPGTVTGRGWFDANDDGSYSASESPLSGIIVNLFDSLGSPALDASLQPVAPTTIDAGATYRFTNLRPGSYTVSFTDTLGYLGPGTAGAVYAGIATVQLAQTAIVNLLFSQVVIPEEPPAPLAPPTADTLTWADFEEVDASQNPDHPDRVAETGWIESRGEIESGKATITYGPQNGPFTATVELLLKKAPLFTAVFDKARSWVVKGKQTPQLLEHERLHLRIAEYIAKKAELNFPADMKGVGEAQGNTKNEAATKAYDAAWDNDLVPRVDAFLAEWSRIDGTIQDLYDSKTETDHGRNPDQQAKWERDWQQRVDAELIKQGWKVQ